MRVVGSTWARRVLIGFPGPAAGLPSAGRPGHTGRLRIGFRPGSRHRAGLAMRGWIACATMKREVVSMPKNIVIFSDGTGQAGGITFDEMRTNVYKLYRATRVGPDTAIDPQEQVAFYDPGLGSPADGSHIKVKWARSIYNFVSMATGLGITANIIDCYAALIRLYREGDRIFLFGFSRGAYTVRSLAGVISYCGIPRQLPGEVPLPMDVQGSRRLARSRHFFHGTSRRQLNYTILAA
jgi:uncharacterized protein (DUF2235 family)